MTPNRLSLQLFASPVYWPDANQRRRIFVAVESALSAAGGDLWEFHRIDSAEAAAEAADSPPAPCAMLALSGGIQPWMQTVAERRHHLALFNGYLPEALPVELAGPLLHANAHPASTDFYAACRLEGKCIQWIDTAEGLADYAHAAQAVERLRAARILRIGETEPWVINSCRSPETIRERIGTEIVPVEREALYARLRAVTEDEARAEAAPWLTRHGGLHGIVPEDVLKASRVTVAMRHLLAAHRADALAMACFAMIGEVDTTSCLALSALNTTAGAIGACEGDLDAALTLFLLKALGADFVWIANPIIHQGDYLDLVHCTAPTCACGRDLPFRLRRHHESGRGVSPEVDLPGGETATIARLSMNVGQLSAHTGVTARPERLPACHTQIRLRVESSEAVLASLLGTHFVLSYGDWFRPLRHAASMLGLAFAGTRRPVVPR
jgi:L-fucose isomerase-like protein